MGGFDSSLLRALNEMVWIVCCDYISKVEVMCIVKFQYTMLALPYDHCLVLLLFLDVPITVIVQSLLLTSFLNVFI